MRRIRQGDDRLLDGAGVFQAQHLAPRDARRVGVDVAADTEQLASHLQPARRIVVEAVAQLGASADVEHANRLRVKIALDPELGPVLEYDLERHPEVAALPWAPAVGAFHQRRVGTIARLEPVEAGDDGFLQRRLAGLVGSDDQVHRRPEPQLHPLQRAKALDLDPG